MTDTLSLAVVGAVVALLVILVALWIGPQVAASLTFVR